MSKVDEAKKLLENLQDRAPDIMDLSIARTNGLVIATLGKTNDPEKKMERLLGAMGSALYSISKRAAEELMHGQFQSLTIQIDSGNIFVVFTGRIILIALTKTEPNLGLISLELEDASDKLNKMFA